MTQDEREHLRTLVSRQRERAEIREAITASGARAEIDRMLGEEFIAAAREVVGAWHEYRDISVLIAAKTSQLRNTEARIYRAVTKLEELVGKP